MMNCPTKIINATLNMPRAWLASLKIEWLVPNTLALNRFQNWSITNTVKKTVR